MVQDALRSIPDEEHLAFHAELLSGGALHMNQLPDDSFESIRRKVAELFGELVGDRAKRLDGSIIAEPAMSTVGFALADAYGEKAHDIAFHLTDWNCDAPFIVAIHLFPERFTADEIEAGVGLFLTHAPNHIRAACGLTGQYVWENFPEDDRTNDTTAPT